MAATNTAYDFERFEVKKPRIKLVEEPQKSKKVKAKARLTPLKAVATCLAAVLIISAVLYNRAQMTELSDKVSKAKSTLSVLENENERLKLSLQGMASLNKVEQYVQQNLNMVKAEKYQITYITVERQNQVTVEKKDENIFDQILDAIKNGF